MFIRKLPARPANSKRSETLAILVEYETDSTLFASLNYRRTPLCRRVCTLKCIGHGTTRRPHQSRFCYTPRRSNKRRRGDNRAGALLHWASRKSLTAESIRLLDPAGKPLPAQLGSDLEGDVVNIRPKDRLKPQSLYTVEVTARLIDKEGDRIAPFARRSPPGAYGGSIHAEGFQFAKAQNPAPSTGPTAIAIGPDGNAYVATYEGILYRLRLDPQTGSSIGKDRLLSISDRKILGLAFDPANRRRACRLDYVRRSHAEQ